jgi:FkbM family methyltransferase
MMRLITHGYDALRLISIYGPVGAAKIISRLLRNGGVVEFRNRGHAYVMPNGLSARYHLLESIDKLRRLADHVRTDDRVVVDVGAHAGLFSAFALERAPHASALAIEPEAAMAPIIARNLASFANWRLVQAAVSDTPGEATFYRATSSQESSLIPATIRSASVRVTVPSVTLDELCTDLPQVDVLKVDVQGAEHLVLAGGRETLPRVRTLLVEVSLVDPQPHHVLDELVTSFGPWRVVNPVYAGADLLFERR